MSIRLIDRHQFSRPATPKHRFLTISGWMFNRFSLVVVECSSHVSIKSGSFLNRNVLGTVVGMAKATGYIACNCHRNSNETISHAMFMRFHMKIHYQSTSQSCFTGIPMNILHAIFIGVPMNIPKYIACNCHCNFK